jgi:hypothetical protein
VDHDSHEEPNDLLPLLNGESGVQAGTNFGEEVTGLLGHHIRL